MTALLVQDDGTAALDPNLSASFRCSYSPPLGTVLNPGTVELTALWEPSAELAGKYQAATKTVSIVVHKIKPRLLWSLPRSIPHDKALTEKEHFTARCEQDGVAGRFQYFCDELPLTFPLLSPSPVLERQQQQPHQIQGLTLVPGVHSLKAVFLPADESQYAGGEVTVELQVDKKDPQLVWEPPPHVKLFSGVPLAKQPELCNAECVSPDVEGRFFYQVREGSLNLTQSSATSAATCTVLARFTPTEEFSRFYNERTLTRVVPVGGNYADWVALVREEDEGEPLLYGGDRVFTLHPYKDKRYISDHSPPRVVGERRVKSASSERSRSPTRPVSRLLSAQKRL